MAFDDDDFDDFVTPAAPKPRGGLDPQFESQVNEIIGAVGQRGLKARLSEGYRSPERQDALYAQGRTQRGPVVTYARGNQGKHTRGRAADIDLIDAQGRPLPNNDPSWKVLGEEAQRRGLTWGGNFPKLKDFRHVEAGQQKPKPVDDDDFDQFVTPLEQSPPPSRRNTSAISPTRATAAPSLIDALENIRRETDAATEGLKRRAARPESVKDRLMRQSAQQRTVDQSQREQEAQLRTEAEAELKSRRGPYRAPTLRGALKVISDPVGEFQNIFKSDEEQINQMVGERRKQIRIAQDPEVTEQRKAYGQMSAPRRVVEAPLQRGGASLLKVGGGIASAFGIAPNQLSEWMNRRGELIESAASLAPLEEDRNLTSLITGDPELKEVERGIPEKIATGVADLGLSLGQIILLKKATKLSFPNLLALEAAAKNSNKPASEQLARAAEGYALGSSLERITSRAANAAVAGVPTAAQTGYEVSQGRMSPVDAAIQTGIQTGVGAILPPARRERVSSTRPSVEPIEVTPELLSKEASSSTQVPNPIDAIENPSVLKPGVEKPQQNTLVPTTADVNAAEPQKFYHRDYGEVVKAEDQSGARRGRVKVYEADNPDKIHYIKDVQQTGAGNQRAVPVKPTTKPTVETPAELKTQPTTTESQLTTPKEVTDATSDPSVAPEAQPPTQAPGQVRTAPTIPERPETIAAQFEALREGRREAVLIPEGTEATAPRGFAKENTPEGPLYFNPDRVSRNQVRQQISDNSYGELLGHVEGKPAPGEPAAVVTAKEGDVEVQSSAVSPERAAEQAQETQARHPDAEVRVGGPELAQEVIADRLNVSRVPLERPTSVKNAATEELRRDLDLLELEGPEVKTWQQTIDNAKSRKLDEQAEQIAQEVISKKRQLSEEDEAGIQLRMRELENRWEEVYRQDPKSPELADIKQRLDNLTQASKEGGTPLARALAFRRSFVDKDYKLISVVQRAEKAAGRRLSEKEFQQFEQQTARVKELEAQLAKANTKAESEGLQRDVDRLARRERRSTAKMTLDTEYETLKGQLAQIRSKTTEGFFRSEKGELDPEAVKIVAKLARNRIRAGITDATQLVDDIYSTVQEHLPNATRRDVQDAISGYGRESQRTRSDEAKQLSQVQSELKKLSAQEDIASGKRLSSQDKRRQTQLRKQEIEIKDRLAREDFDQRPPRPKPHYTRETRKLQEEIQNLKNKLDLEIERNRPGHGWRTFSALRKSWMLSGLSTQAKNILGTGGYQAFDELARIPAVITDAAVAGVTKQRGISTSPTQALDGILQAYRVGGKEAKEILKRGATQEQLERHQFSEIDTGVKLIDFTGNIVFRFMSASDRVFYNYAYKRNLQDRATVQAKNEGAGRGRAKELSDNPPEELDAAAKHDALVSTFNNNNKLSNAIKSARAQLGPKANFAIDLVMPFDRTPTNVIARILEASPAGFAKAATGGYKQSPLKVAKSIIDKTMTVEEQRQFSQTIGRATAGSAIIGLGWALGDSLFDVEKYKVYIKIPGVGRFDLTGFSPLGNMLALGARYRKNYEEGKPWEAVKSTTRVPLDQPLLQAGSNVADVIKDPERSFTRQAARTASSFIPFGGAARDLAKVLDPEEKRKATGFTEQIQQGIPGWRQSLPVDVDKKQQRERRTEDVRQGSLSPMDLEMMVQSGEITEAQRKQILRESKMEASQARFNAIAPATALERYERMDAAQRQEVEEVMSRKAHSLLNSDSLTDAEKEAFRARIEALGITPQAPKRNTGNRATRGFQSTFK